MSCSHLTEEVSLFLPLTQTGQVAAHHQVRVVQDCVKPAASGEESLRGRWSGGGEGGKEGAEGKERGGREPELERGIEDRE